MISKRLATAALEPLVLSLLAQGPKYGFQIAYQVEVMSKNDMQLPNSMLYPLLHGLERQKLVSSFWKPSDDGPKRKYYKLTPKGSEALESARSEWSRVHGLITNLSI